jgi:hypothetical protein
MQKILKGSLDVMTMVSGFRGALVGAVMAAGVSHVAMIGLGAGPAAAQLAKPSSVDILFERKHLSNAPAGTDLVYKFQRTVSATEVLGQPFSDEIKIEIKKAAPDGSRDLFVKVYTGERARDPQFFDGLTSNPILIVFLDRAISSYMSVAGGKVPYLKDKLRTAMRERATIEPVKVKLGDKVVDAQRVTVSPYVGDLNASKMRGYENSRFSFVVSEAVPGQYVELLAVYENNSKDAPRLEERTVMVGAEVVK